MTKFEQFLEESIFGDSYRENSLRALMSGVRAEEAILYKMVEQHENPESINDLYAAIARSLVLTRYRVIRWQHKFCPEILAVCAWVEPEYVTYV